MCKYEFSSAFVITHTEKKRKQSNVMQNEKKKNRKKTPTTRKYGRRVIYMLLQLSNENIRFCLFGLVEMAVA